MYHVPVNDTLRVELTPEMQERLEKYPIVSPDGRLDRIHWDFSEPFDASQPAELVRCLECNAIMVRNAGNLQDTACSACLVLQIQNFTQWRMAREARTNLR